MKLVLEISEGGEGEAVLHRVVETFPVSVGRGYHNDIILTDPHVGDRHFSIDFDGADWTLTDFGSINPTTLNTRAVRATTAKLMSGDVLRAGSTTLRLFSPGHPVEAPVRLQKAHPVFAALMRPVNIWVFFLLAIAAVTAWTYATVWSDDVSITLSGAGAGAALVILVWAALWAVAGRMIRRRAYFLWHLAMMSLYLALGALVAALSAALDFVLNESSVALAAGYVMNGALLGLLLYGSLSISTLMKKKKRIAAAVFCALGLVLGIFAVGMVQGGRFNPDPDYPYRLMPYLGRIVPVVTMDKFMEDSADVFTSDVFNAKPETE